MKNSHILSDVLAKHRFLNNPHDQSFLKRLQQHESTINGLYVQLYGDTYAALFLDQLYRLLINTHVERAPHFKQRDAQKAGEQKWFLSNDIVGMSLYVDRFAGSINAMNQKLPYLQQLGVNFLHLMPLMESPADASDGGYAVSNFRKVDERFGNITDLKNLQQNMQQKGMYLMLDIVLNHASNQHEWAIKAKQGDKKYQDFFYMYDDRVVPDQFESTMPEVFPESSPGNFTYVPELNKWVMTVFHHYQWDLNFTNPAVLIAMLENIFFYANIGVDVLRIDAPAFIWKQLGTTCQNLPLAHTILQLIKQCVNVATPGMALLGEAIVAPKDIMKYFGEGAFYANECDVAYNATQMALQWDAIATGDTTIMLAAQQEILKKPYGTTWINYTRCHDDIGLGYEDEMIAQAGYNPYEHRKFLMNYFSGNHAYSSASGALFSVNPKTNDARISGTLASLCGLENAINNNDAALIETAIKRIIVMQACAIFYGGLPMLYYGDEVGYTNDYSYLNDAAKSYDNRWMHRPIIDWQKNDLIQTKGSIEQRIFEATQQLITIRKQLPAISDLKNIHWLPPHNIHVAGYVRHTADQHIYCLFNFSNEVAFLTWYAFKSFSKNLTTVTDLVTNKTYNIGPDAAYLILEPYQYLILTTA
ncbi:alpha-amylase family glycosyl hydrolase [Ferruginibacter yonginensis]|uniref:Alpha-amylase family glycosyl hydrolase n=1 Tax=Ferruginibacter yonginensis TaxID=1310416 RepID=A0ABV8QRE9_9BACT